MIIMIWIWRPWGWILILIFMFLQSQTAATAESSSHLPAPPPTAAGGIEDQHVASSARAVAPLLAEGASRFMNVFEVVDVQNNDVYPPDHASWPGLHEKLNGFSFSAGGKRGALPEDCAATRRLLVINNLCTAVVGGIVAGGITAMGKPAHQVLTGSVDAPYAGCDSHPLGHALACGEPLRVPPLSPDDPMLAALPSEDRGRAPFNLVAHPAFMDPARGPSSANPRVVSGAVVSSTSEDAPEVSIDLLPSAGQAAVAEQVGGEVGCTCHGQSKAAVKASPPSGRNGSQTPSSASRN